MTDACVVLGWFDPDYFNGGRMQLDADARPAQAVEYENPFGEVGIDQQVLSTDLEEEAGMADESHAHLARFSEDWPACIAGARRHCRMTHEL